MQVFFLKKPFIFKFNRHFYNKKTDFYQKIEEIINNSMIFTIYLGSSSAYFETVVRLYRYRAQQYYRNRHQLAVLNH